MISPRDRDLLIKCERDSGYLIVEALTGEQIAGPFARVQDAMGAAWSIAAKRSTARIFWQQEGAVEISVVRV